MKKLSKEAAIESLKFVVDPEIGLDVYTLGLIYEIKIKSKNEIEIIMTLTSPMCPYAPQLMQDIKDELKNKGFKKPKVEIVFDPPWNPSQDVKLMLGLR